MTTRRLFMAGLPLLMLAGCGGGDDSTGPQTIDFSIVDRSTFSNIRTQRFAVARTDADWSALWAEYKGSLGFQKPAIDFGSSMVVAVFAGERPSGCFTADIKRVVREAGVIRVEYTVKFTGGANTTCTAALTYPAVLATVARSDLTVNFVQVDQ